MKSLCDTIGERKYVQKNYTQRLNTQKTNRTDINTDLRTLRNRYYFN
jgi:hypothetical protein